MDDLYEALLREENAHFSGWDFSYLNSRWAHGELPWDYRKEIEKYLKPSDTLLDMGTGGGEFLMSLGHPYKLTYATEGYEPNYELCKNKFGKLGIDVRYFEDDDKLPFEDIMFDIIINRHESYSPTEVKRLLKPDGVFITQQVGGRNNLELSQRLIGHITKTQWDLSYAQKQLTDCGFNILFSDEYYPELKFFDTGALVYCAKAAVWDFPGFSVKRCYGELRKIENEIKVNGFIASKEHRFILEVKIAV